MESLSFWMFSSMVLKRSSFDLQVAVWSLRLLMLISLRQILHFTITDWMVIFFFWCMYLLETHKKQNSLGNCYPNFFYLLLIANHFLALATTYFWKISSDFFVRSRQSDIILFSKPNSSLNLEFEMSLAFKRLIDSERIIQLLDDNLNLSW